MADTAAGSGELGISDLQKSGAHVNLCLQAPEVQCREPCQSVALLLKNPKQKGMGHGHICVWLGKARVLWRRMRMRFVPSPGGNRCGNWEQPLFSPLGWWKLTSTSPETRFGAGMIHKLERDKLLTNIICKRIIQPAPFLGYTADNFAMQKEKKDQNQPTCQGT